MSIRLVKYEAARVALKEASQVDEVKDIHDKAQAMAAYALQIKNEDMYKWVSDIKLRAERRMGELLEEVGPNRGAATPKTSQNDNAVTHSDRVKPTLAEIGISKKQSTDFKAIAAIPEERFEEEVQTGKATTTSLVRVSPKNEKKTKAEPKKKKAKPAPKSDDDSCSVAELGKALEESDKEVRGLQALVESLKKDDLAKEVAKWHLKFDQLEGRLSLAVKQKNEADKHAKYSTGLLRKIREALKVTKDSEILQAIRNS